MKRVLTVLVLVALLSTMVEAAPRTPSIDQLTLAELRGPKIPKDFHDGVMTGVVLTIASTGAVRCQMMSTTMVIAAIDAALKSHEITLAWRPYNAVLYVLTRSGCEANPDPEPEPAVPQEKPNA